MQRKNISKILSDIRQPEQEKRAQFNAEKFSGASKLKMDFAARKNIKSVPILIQKYAQKQLSSRATKTAKVIIALILAILIFYGILIAVFAGKTFFSAQFLRGEWQQIKSALTAFQIQEITKHLTATDAEIKKIESEADKYGITELAGALGKTIPGLSALPGTMRSVSLLSESVLGLSRNLEILKNEGLQMMLQKRGGEFIALLENMEANLASARQALPEVRNQISRFKNASPEITELADAIDGNYLFITLNLNRMANALHAFIGLIKAPGDRHLLLMFQNETEIRPSGGFMGSYGDITINSGSITDIRIDDIYNADRQIDLKIAPPKELQSITTKWGARDAGWFFDFPLSAGKTIYFLENAKLHYEKLVRFDAAIAINTEILKSIFEIIGPVELPAYKLTLDQNNFLKEIQYEVEAGQDKKPGQNPKRILSALSPILFERLEKLGENQKKILIEKISSHFKNKDAMVYFKDKDLKNAADSLNIGGLSYRPEPGFFGDYLAIVNANIAAGKTDAFITQKIILESRLSDDGKLENTLTVSRRHTGQREKEWWYRVSNKNYMKIFTPQETNFLAISGNSSAPKPTAFDYAENGYQNDEDISIIQNTTLYLEKLNAWRGQESGKVFLGAWFNTPPGETKKLKTNYENTVRLNFTNGSKFKFIFEKQSGNKTSLEYSITAPAGYKWKETDNDIFSINIDNPKAREIIELTLIKIS